ncbi:unnamed protein product [Spirodela intermedia]|uniref:Uncharacterized protein n=1 Tax=Spirodela intermedia TaxID=51605 RepID=A0A7I8LBA3_SPIIN|nr:unnamed protein product [Spirodela intermedia]CAA7406555.1 unnamed protein product [Spirodela intermedia]
MASKALPLLGFLLIAMLLVSAAVDAKDSKDKETKISVDQGGGFPYPGGGGGGGGYPYPGGGGGYPYPGGGGGGYPYPGGGGGYPYPGGGGGGGGYPPWWRCRYRCCNRFRYNCWCCSRKEYMAAAEKHN